nr:non capsid protein NS 1 [Hymenolepis microstoma]CUU98103.1 non capsid protein NS 1 [Hymenolepis microstoma]
MQSPNTQRLKDEQTKSHLENRRGMKHEYSVGNTRDIDLGTNWLMMMLSQHGIDIDELLKDIAYIMDRKKTTKVNSLCFKGQTNTGKKLLANFITPHLTLGTVCRRGDRTAFHFDNLLNRTVTLMEEPKITTTTKSAYKCLLGGDRFEIDVNYGARRFLQRIPVVDTTNEDVGALLTSIDRAALYSRVKQYTLNEQDILATHKWYNRKMLRDIMCLPFA